MASADDFFNQLVIANGKLDTANGKLDTLHGDLTALKASTDAVQQAVGQVNATLTGGIRQLIALGQYTNQALYHNDQQNDTMICILEHIAKNTCELLNQSVVQTRLQTDLEDDVDALRHMYATVNAAAALERERLHKLKKEMEECCPPEVPKPLCDYAPCPAPRPIAPPPQSGPGPIK